eukprot:scaffold1996_cov132-Isochrysis_galbana.AAC.5
MKELHASCAAARGELGDLVTTSSGWWSFGVGKLAPLISIASMREARRCLELFKIWVAFHAQEHAVAALHPVKKSAVEGLWRRSNGRIERVMHAVCGGRGSPSSAPECLELAGDIPSAEGTAQPLEEVSCPPANKALRGAPAWLALSCSRSSAEGRPLEPPADAGRRRGAERPIAAGLAHSGLEHRGRRIKEAPLAVAHGLEHHGRRLHDLAAISARHLVCARVEPVMPLHTGGAISRSAIRGVRTRFQRLGVVAEVLAVPLQRPQRAEADPALADVNIATRLHVHGQVLLDNEALLVALRASEWLFALEMTPKEVFLGLVLGCKLLQRA